MKQLKTFTTSFAVLCVLLQLFFAIPSYGEDASETIENPGHCKQCGMDRTVFARSRMLIIHADGTTAGVCSIHCAAAELRQNSGKQAKSIMVADYATKKLTEAGTAVWVIGGSKGGVMTAVPKWAFAKEEEALQFVKENGGEIASFDQAMKAAEGELDKGGAMGHAHMGHDMSMHMGPGAQMLFNPAFGDDIYHTHPAGMWMVTYKLMHMNMSGLRAGTSDVDLSNIGYKRGKPYDYMMIPTDMTMDMHMFMLMCGITDRLTVMAMTNYQVNSMGMLMDMGPGKMITREDDMTTRGFSDSELRGIYKLNKYLVGSLGIGLPTGSIDETVVMMKKEYRAPYDMQLGSGTFDFRPALTYNVLSEDAKWNWGAQLMYTLRVGTNKNGYRLGNNLKATGWLQREIGPLTSWVRLVFNDTDRIHGQDPEIDKLNHPPTGMGAPTPDADPNNYGGQRLDGLIGLSCRMGSLSFGVEGGIPVYQYLNGLQMKTTWIVNAGVQVMF